MSLFLLCQSLLYSGKLMFLLFFFLLDKSLLKLGFFFFCLVLNFFGYFNQLSLLECCMIQPKYVLDLVDELQW